MFRPRTRGGLIRLTLLLVLGGLVLWLALYYLSDPPVEADVVEKDCSLGGGFIVAKTRLFGTRHRAELALTECGAIPLGAYVVYHLRSGHTTVYEQEGGRCIYDSVLQGPCR